MNPNRSLSNSRKKLLRELVLLGLMMTIFPQFIAGQCNSDILLDKCASNLGTYNYIKTFVAHSNPKRKNTADNIYVFSKGSTYKMIACSQTGGNTIISLYDKDHSLIASTYDQKQNKYYTELEYPCSATGVYYINTTFEGIKNGCGLCILGFSKEAK